MADQGSSSVLIAMCSAWRAHSGNHHHESEEGRMHTVKYYCFLMA